MPDRPSPQPNAAQIQAEKYQEYQEEQKEKDRIKRTDKKKPWLTSQKQEVMRVLHKTINEV